MSPSDLNGDFNDSPASPTQNLLVSHNAYAWSTPGNTKYVIVEYLIKNNGTSILSNLHAGIFADWDIDASSYANNKSDFDATHNMGYAWCTDNGGKWTGIKLLTGSAPPVFYSVDNISGGNGGVNLFDGYDTNEKFTTLSTNRYIGGTSAPAGNDVINIMSAGPYNLNAGDTAIVAFALLAGDSLLDLQKTADSAQYHYDFYPLPPPPVGIKSTDINSAITIYPNPANESINIKVTNSENEWVELSIKDMIGKTIIIEKRKITNNTLNIDVSKLNEGVYFLKVNGSLQKFVVLR